ncbi:MAG TPA: pyruvate kinase [Bryobacteraceae bacterium]|nr:pyruvate kinase [Bryobacteraceae bacterium]
MKKHADMRMTKIVATLGPASDSPETLGKLFDAGVDVFRLNASHGVQADHARRLQLVRQIAAERQVHAGVLLDLQGPKIRLGTFENGGCTLENGRTFRITTDIVSGTCERASTTYADFVKDIKSGDQVLLADGSVELKVMDKTATDAICQVVSGGPIGDRKGINLPGVEVSTSSLTKKDVADLRFGLEAGVDFVALSFVRKRDDVLKLRLYLEETDSRVQIIAKIEKPEAWKNLDAILEESDGVMVARGDLGVEMALEKVPFIQKSIIERSRKHGKFVITATQMLESMIEHPYPTRAEVSDIANAIYDGTDAVMLSAETSSGSYPVEATRMMSRIALESEASIRNQGFKDPPKREAQPTYAEIVADTAYRAARMQGASAIIVFTASGSSARLVSRYRPPVPIYAFTGSELVARQLSVIYGVHAILSPDPTHTDEMVALMDRMLLERGLVQERDSVVFIAGQPIGRPGTTNLLKLHRIGELW